MENWFDSRSEVLAFAHVMLAGEMFDCVADVIYFFEKPWKWTGERDRWVAAGRPETFDFDADALSKLDAFLASHSEGTEP